MKKIIKSIGTLLVAFGLLGCGKVDVPATEKAPILESSSSEHFNSDNYDLKIKNKYPNVDGKLDFSNNKKQHIRAARKLATRNGVAEAKGNSIVLSIDDEGIETLTQLDPDLNINSTGQAARILTAPEKATLVEVVGTKRDSLSDNTANEIETENDSIVAPSKFQMVEYDANGTYGIDIGSDIYQKLDLTNYANGVIQPRSIKTKDFRFSDSKLNFTTARTDVYFIKEGDYNGISEEKPYEFGVEVHRLTDYEKYIKPELYNLAKTVLLGNEQDKEHTPGYFVASKFNIEVSDLDNLKEGIHKITISCEAKNHKFSYCSDICINIKYIGRNYPVLYPKPGVTMTFDAQSPEFPTNYGYCFTNKVDVITRDYTKEENLKRLKDNYDIYMVTDFDKKTNLIDSAVLYTCAEAPEIIHRSDDWCDFILQIGDFFYYIG